MLGSVREFLEVCRAFFRAAWVMSFKSPANVWIANLLRIVYYAAMFLFWYGVRSTTAGADFMSRADVYGFLLTVGVVENLYLSFVGRGSLDLAYRISALTLDPMLVWPRHPLTFFVLLRPNPVYFPILAIFLIAQVLYYAYHHLPLTIVGGHLVTIVCGAFILSGISFVYRLTTFWTDSIIRVKHSNPSFKILIRPASAFDGKLRFILLTFFPALFITGIPFEVLTSRRQLGWIALCLLATAAVWVYVLLLWRFGVRRYGKIAA